MASVYQKIHAFALKAQARHLLQFKGGLHQAATNFASCNQQLRWQQAFDNLDMQESLIAPHAHNHQHSGSGRNLPCASGLNDSMNPIDKTISSLGYSSIPYFLFESHVSKPNQRSKKYVMRSEDGWLEGSEVNVWTDDPTVLSKPIAGHPAAQLAPGRRTYSSRDLEIDGDTDSSSTAPSIKPDSEALHRRCMTVDVGGGKWEEELNVKLCRSHRNKAQQLAIGPIGPQNIPLKGMARLRRISPRPIQTATLQNDPSRANAIQGDIEEREANQDYIDIC
ncbi:hypothetical protein BYT27DRAFT_7258281 [Phlegmacium glaucopus]|nr:hypothetical protein BYT27DRAFT_7258281 [Phlegmacium glaucopus]